MELPKTDEGLGFNVMGGKEQNSPIYISRIIPGKIQTISYFKRSIEYKMHLTNSSNPIILILLIRKYAIKGGVADRVGGLKRGDQLLSVNGVSVEGEHHEKAVELLKAAVGSVKLVVRYTPKVLEEMEMRFDKQRQARRRHLYS